MTQPQTQVTRKQTRDDLSGTVQRKVTQLQKQVHANDAWAVATLARLRRCDPADVGADPTVWQVTFSDLPPSLTSLGGHQSDAPTPAERALHATLVLYAHHQQSRDEDVHRPSVSVGHATARLARARSDGDDLDKSSVGRLHQAGLATTFEGSVHHLRALVQLMRAEKPPIALDYSRLAVDLWQLADPYQDSTQVLARWGRDLYARPKPTTPEPETSPTQPTSEETQK